MSRPFRRPVYTSPRMTVEFEMDRRGMAEVARGKELRVAVKTIALRGKAYAESISPARTGNYRRSFRVNLGRKLIHGMRRVVAILANTDPAAVAIEVGTAIRPMGQGGGTPAHRVLQRTLTHLGGRGALSRLSAPTVRSNAPARSIPTVDEFRERRRRRQRRRRARRGGN